jgi:hypothetical protein
VRRWLIAVFDALSFVHPGGDPDTLRPDAMTFSGRPVELKPNTPSGHRQGKTQTKKYEGATGKRGRVVYYDR